MLKLTDIDKTFNAGTIDEKVLFDKFSLSIDEGEFVSVVGSNGSGKTTMLNIISGDVLPDGGHVELKGKDITKMKNFVRAKNIARVFQNPAMGTCLLDEHTAALDPKSADIVMELTRDIVEESKITTVMITHNLRYAVEYGTRAIMMHEGNVILDLKGEEKAEQSIDDYLKIFNEISIECGN
mgnify:CR=1 FL=1